MTKLLTTDSFSITPTIIDSFTKDLTWTATDYIYLNARQTLKKTFPPGEHIFAQIHIYPIIYCTLREHISLLISYMAQKSVLGIATGYGLDGPGIEYRWGEIFHSCPDQPWSPPSLLYNWYRVISAVKAAGN